MLHTIIFKYQFNQLSDYGPIFPKNTIPRQAKRHSFFPRKKPNKKIIITSEGCVINANHNSSQNIDDYF